MGARSGSAGAAGTDDGTAPASRWAIPRSAIALALLVAATLATGAAAAPVYPCLIQAEDYAGGGEGSGYHDTTPGNQGGAYRDDDVDLWTDESGNAFVMGTAPGEWLDYDFVVEAADTEHYPIPVLLRFTADRRECWIGVSLDGATPRTFPVWATPGAWVTDTVEMEYPAIGPHHLRVTFPDSDLWLDSIQLADNHASGWADTWGGDPGLKASVAPISGCAPLTVRFADRSRPYPMFNWQWNFGDGNHSYEQNPVHAYTAPGRYTVEFFAQPDSYWNYPMWHAVWDMDRYSVYPGPVTVFPPPGALPGSNRTPLDPDGDGLYEDLNGNARADFADVVLYFGHVEWIVANGPIVAFDYTVNGRIDFADVVALFGRL